MKRLSIISTVALFIALVSSVFWVWRSMERLKEENERLAAAAAAAGLERESRLFKAEGDPEQAERARKAQSELLRLRGEVSVLRAQLKEEIDARAAAESRLKGIAEDLAVEVEPEPPVQSYSATVHASLQPNQTLATGGWTLPSGNRGIVMVEPLVIAEDGQAPQVVLQAKFVELPDETLASIGLIGLRMEGGSVMNQSVTLDAAYARSILQSLERLEGASVLAAPTVVTLDGIQAQVSAVNMKSFEGQMYQIGPTIDVIPKITDRSGAMDLTVVASLQLETTPPR